MNQTEKHHLLFAQLVISLHAATMQQLGKLKSPLSGKVERDLSGAQASIDMLDMLREKTRGNLTAEEEAFMEHLLTDLRLRYVSKASRSP